MKTFKEFLNEATEVTFFKKNPKLANKDFGNSKWFRFSEAETKTLINILKKVNSPLSNEIAKDAENGEKYSKTTTVQVGDKFYGLYFSDGLATMAAGGEFDNPNTRTQQEIQDAIKSGKYNII